jgi:N-methylhydantoinase A
MSDLIRRMSVQRGVDPRDFVCFAFGGAGPVHAGALAQEIGLREVVIPLGEIAPVWSALGAATADVTHLYQMPAKRTIPMPASPAVISEAFEVLEDQARGTLRSEGFGDANISLVRAVRMKHAAQVYDIEVPVPGGVLQDDDIEELDRRFDRVYDERFGQGAGYRQAGVEITGFEVRATSNTYKPELGRALPTNPSIDRSERAVYWWELEGWVETPVLRLAGGSLPEAFDGPVLIELPNTVVVVRPNQTVRSDEGGNLVLTV